MKKVIDRISERPQRCPFKKNKEGSGDNKGKAFQAEEMETPQSC